MPQGNYSWNRTRADDTVYLPCVHDGVNGTAANASRLCNNYGVWKSVSYQDCRTYAQSVLQRIENVSNKAASHSGGLWFVINNGTDSDCNDQQFLIPLPFKQSVFRDGFVHAVFYIAAYGPHKP